MSKKEEDGAFSFKRASEEQNQRETENIQRAVESYLTEELNTTRILRLIKIAEESELLERLISTRDLLGARLNWRIQPFGTPINVQDVVAATLKLWVPMLENASKYHPKFPVLDFGDSEDLSNLLASHLKTDRLGVWDYKFPISPWPRIEEYDFIKHRYESSDHTPIDNDTQVFLHDLEVSWKEQQREPSLVFVFEEPTVRFHGMPDRNDWFFLVLVSSETISFVGSKPIVIPLSTSSTETKEEIKIAIEAMITDPIRYPIPISREQYDKHNEFINRKYRRKEI